MFVTYVRQVVLILKSKPHLFYPVGFHAGNYCAARLEYAKNHFELRHCPDGGEDAS